MNVDKLEKKLMKKAFPKYPCPNCGANMNYKKIKQGKSYWSIWSCKNCGYSDKDKYD
jgi:predicted RNA-binding Zn-ribbon protein involved in translation (DUF1610 family)